MERFAKRIMPECRCAARIFSGQEWVCVCVCQEHKEKRPAWQHFGFFSDRYFQNYILNGKFNPKDGHNQGLSWQNHFFRFSKRVGEASPLSPTCAPVSVAQNAWIWYGYISKVYKWVPNMSDYGSIRFNNVWICLNISQYTWTWLNIADCPKICMKMPE